MKYIYIYIIEERTVCGGLEQGENVNLLSREGARVGGLESDMT